MDMLSTFLGQFLQQLQSPTLAFLLGGVLVAAMGSKLTIPNQIYQFVVFVLLMKIGMKGGVEIREASLLEMLLPAALSAIIGLVIVWIGHALLAKLPRIQAADGTATAGLFGAVSASTLAAAIVLLEEQNIPFEAWAPTLYPFMDIPALVLAIVLASIHKEKSENGQHHQVNIWQIVRDSLRGSALSALLLGICLVVFGVSLSPWFCSYARNGTPVQLHLNG